MGNRVSTSATPFSLEDLEAIARSPLLSSSSSSAALPSPFDALAADLAAAVTSPSPAASNSRKSATAAADGGAAAGISSSSGSGNGTGTVHFRKENLRGEMEQQFADVDTSLHAWRCLPNIHNSSSSSMLPHHSSGDDRSKRVPLSSSTTATSSPQRAQSSKKSARPSSRRGSRHSDPQAGASDTDTEKEERRGGSAQRQTHRSVPGAAATLSVTSPRSSLFRNVSVQAVDLTQAVDVEATEVYVVVLVQRATPGGTGGSSSSNPSPASLQATAGPITPLPLSTLGAANASAGGHVVRGSTVPRTPALAAGAAAAAVAASAAEWPREMAHAFTPRGVATPLSSNVNRPSASSSFFGAGGGAWWISPSATPRTNGSTSNRGTPRGGAFPGSPRSTSSLPTPRTSGFHYSIHLLTGKQADALTAAAGFVAARSIERLFLECSDFDRRLFFHVHTSKAEEMIRAYRLYLSELGSPAGQRGGAAGDGAANARSALKSGGSGSGRGGAPSSSLASGAAGLSKGVQRGLSTAGGGGSRSGSVGLVASGVSPGGTKTSSLYYLTASQEAAKELLRELLALMRPVPAVAPHFAAPAGTPASTASAVFPAGGVSASGQPAEVRTLASSTTAAELYSTNALFRILHGLRAGSPRWPYASDTMTPLSSARISVTGAPAPAPGSGATTPNYFVGMSQWHHEPLPAFRPPRRGPSLLAMSDAYSNTTTTTAAAAAAAAAADGSQHPPTTSAWLQGPQPLDVHSAAAATAPAAASAPPALPSPSSHTPRGTTRGAVGRPWSAGPEGRAKPITGHPYCPTAPQQLPTLALSSLGPKTRRGAPAETPPPSTLLQTATPSPAASPQRSTEPLKFPLALDGTRSSSGAATAALHIPGLADAAAGSAGGRSSSPRPTTDGNGSAGETTADRAARTRSQQPAPLPSRGVAGRGDAASAAGQGTRERFPDAVVLLPSAAHKAGGDANGAAAADDGDDDEDFNEVSTQHERAQRLKAAQPEVTEVLPYLFVGGETAARDRDQLLRKGITHVVNTVSWCLDSFYPDAFRYLTLSLSDAADEPIFSLFATVNAFVERAVRSAGNKGKVFIHCQQGVSRSCTFVIAYVMWKLGLCYDRAYELVRARRNVCSPNTGFLMNLRLWEAHLSAPQLNSIYAFGPYSEESPTPFVYQLATFFTCTTASVEAVAGASKTAQDSADYYYQLCADVLRRATDQRSAGPVDTIELDPRMCYLFLCAPLPPSGTGSKAAQTAATATAAAGPAEVEATTVEACVLVGESCAPSEYAKQALLAVHELLRCGFYQGEAHISVDDAGRAVSFAPLRRVRLTPAPRGSGTISRSAPLQQSMPVTPATLAEAQAVLSRHVSGRCSIVYKPQPTWESLLSLPNLATRLITSIAADQRAEVAEMKRRCLREAELTRLRAAGGDGSSSSGGATGTASAFPAGPQPPTTPSPTPSSSTQVFRSGRLTPRAVRLPQGVAADSSGTNGAAAVAAGVAGLSPSERDGAAGGSSGTPQTALSLALSLPKGAATKRDTKPNTGAVTAASADDGAAAVPPMRHRAGDGRSGNVPARTPSAPSIRGMTGSAAVRSPSPPPLTQGVGAASTTAAAPNTAVPTQLPGGDSFAFTFPFDAASKALVTDMDDLESDQCYAVGFQQPSGVTVYLWRGAESPLEVYEVVDAFVDSMVAVPGDSKQGEAAAAAVLDSVRGSLDRMEWTTCSLHMPGAGERKDGGRGSSGVVVVPEVRVLFVEQGDEPKEFVTLL